MITNDVTTIVALLSAWIILIQIAGHAYTVAVTRGARKTRRRCHEIVARNSQGYLALCALPSGHTGHCAATLPSLQRIGYTMPEF